MLNLHFMYVPVPVLTVDPARVIETNVAWCRWWISCWCPPTREVIAWPKTLAELPARPHIAPEDLPEGVLRFADA
jgi:hypothetical protein